MKKTITTVLLMAILIANSQTRHRKTRSDKGKTHTHSASYNVKKAVKSSTAPKKTKTRK